MRCSLYYTQICLDRYLNGIHFDMEHVSRSWWLLEVCKALRSLRLKPERLDAPTESLWLVDEEAT